MKRAVVLLSGGLDSATVLAWMRREGFACHALSFRYGQRHGIELHRASELARALGASDPANGVNAIDYTGSPDCRPEFIAAFEHLANLATKAGAQEGARFRIHTPLQSLSKAGIVRLALELGVPVARTISCYDPGTDGEPCGRCDACLLRRKGFLEAGAVDA